MDNLSQQLFSREHRQAAFAALLDSSRRNGGVLMVPNPSKFFTIVRDTLLDSSTETLQTVQLLLQETIPEFGPDLESNFSPLLHPLVMLLQDQRPGIAKNSLDTLKAYIKATRNVESVIFALQKWGLQSSEWRLRHQCLQCLVPLIQLDLSYSANSREMQKLLESVLALVKDPYGHVAESAKGVAIQLKNLCYDFPGVFARLSFGYQQTYKDNIEEVKTTEPSLAFGFVSVNLMRDLETENWKTRVGAIQELESQVESLKSGDVLVPHIDSFARFLGKLLSDHNFKVMLSALNIVKTLASMSELASRLAVLVPECLSKLGDNKITIRQAGFQVFRTFLTKLKASLLFPQLVEALGSSNWHIREEVTSVLIAAMLTVRHDFKFDFLSLVQPFAKLLDDSKTKIRFVATEALAVCAKRCGLNVVKETLRPIVDPPAFKSLEERFKIEQLPVLHTDFIEFPKSIPSSAPTISSPYITSQSFAKTPTIEKKMNRTVITNDTPIKLRYETAKRGYSQKTRLETKKWEAPKKPEFKRPEAPVKRGEPKRTEPVKRHNSDEVSNSQSSPALRKSTGHNSVKEFVSSDTSMYLTRDNLQPLPNPESALSRSLQASKSGEWSTQFEILNTFRQLLKYHTHLFNPSNTHTIINDVVSWADSLRSSLSKNALIVIGEICEYLGRSIDSEIPLLYKTLMKKVIDTNVFISGEASKSLEALCLHCNEQKIVSCMLGNSVNSRNPTVKSKICMAFEVLFTKQARLKEMDQIVKLLGSFVTDASPSVRDGARRAFSALQEFYGDFESLLHLLPESTVRKLSDLIQRPPEQTPKRRSQAQLRTEKQNEKLPDLDNLQKISADLENSAWKVRYDALGELLGYVNSYAAAIKASSKLISVVDILAKVLTDQNLKVLIHALSTLIKIIPALGRALEPHLGNLATALLPALGSSNSSIREMAKETLNLIIGHCEGHSVLPALVSILPNGNPRAKHTLLAFINDLLPEVSERRPALVHKHVVPLCFRILDEKKREMQEPVHALIASVYNTLGAGFLDSVPPQRLQEVIDILNQTL